MAIEPISTAMTYQAQSQPQVTRSAETSSAKVDTEVAQASPKAADAQTIYIRETESKDGQNGSDQGTSQQGQQQATNENIRRAVDEMNRKMENSEAVFGVHEKTNRVTIKIVDKETKNVIKEFPPEKTLDMIAKVWELAGILVDEKR